MGGGWRYHRDDCRDTEIGIGVFRWGGRLMIVRGAEVGVYLPLGERGWDWGISVAGPVDDREGWEGSTTTIVEILRLEMGYPDGVVGR